MKVLVNDNYLDIFINISDAIKSAVKEWDEICCKQIMPTQFNIMSYRKDKMKADGKWSDNYEAQWMSIQKDVLEIRERLQNIKSALTKSKAVRELNIK